MAGEIEVWCDGACDKERLGGWAFVWRVAGNPFGYSEASGAVRDTTSQRMELTALLRCLEIFPTQRTFIVHTDSAYLMNCFVEKWYVKWRQRGWLTSKGTPVENRDLWEALLALAERHELLWIKVRGHAGNVMNEHADKLAVKARLSARVT